jgi:catechol 2,3-dioxygenase-like lactoylglutathione lyase family enzyme
MAPLTQQVLHICIAVPDLDAALEFYRDVLGLQSVFDTENGNADGALLGFDVDVVSIKAQHVMAIGTPSPDATAINLVEFLEPKTTSAGSALRAMNDAGLTRLALLVDDLDRAFEAIASHRGVEIICEPTEVIIREAESSHSSRWFSFRDPFGVFITVTAPLREAEREM